MQKLCNNIYCMINLYILIAHLCSNYMLIDIFVLWMELKHNKQRFFSILEFANTG